MINEEVTKNTLIIELKVAHLSLREFFKLLRKVNSEINNSGSFDKVINEKGNRARFKDMHLEEVHTQEPYIKNIRRLLNENGVSFSVMKNNKDSEYSILFQSKNSKVMSKAFDKVALSLSNSKKKEFSYKDIEVFKKIINSVSQNKVKNYREIFHKER